ncbi:MAG: hypothetical protein QXU98_06125 [Candidatus Parvarchaeota archaeon]
MPNKILLMAVFFFALFSLSINASFNIPYYYKNYVNITNINWYNSTYIPATNSIVKVNTALVEIPNLNEPFLAEAYNGSKFAGYAVALVQMGNYVVFSNRTLNNQTYTTLSIFYNATSNKANTSIIYQKIIPLSPTIQGFIPLNYVDNYQFLNNNTILDTFKYELATYPTTIFSTPVMELIQINPSASFNLTIHRSFNTEQFFTENSLISNLSTIGTFSRRWVLANTITPLIMYMSPNFVYTNAGLYLLPNSTIANSTTTLATGYGIFSQNFPYVFQIKAPAGEYSFDLLPVASQNYTATYYTIANVVIPNSTGLQWEYEINITNINWTFSFHSLANVVIPPNSISLNANWLLVNLTRYTNYGSCSNLQINTYQPFYKAQIPFAVLSCTTNQIQLLISNRTTNNYAFKNFTILLVNNLNASGFATPSLISNFQQVYTNTAGSLINQTRILTFTGILHSNDYVATNFGDISAYSNGKPYLSAIYNTYGNRQILNQTNIPTSFQIISDVPISGISGMVSGTGGGLMSKNLIIDEWAMYVSGYPNNENVSFGNVSIGVNQLPPGYRYVQNPSFSFASYNNTLLVREPYTTLYTMGNITAITPPTTSTNSTPTLPIKPPASSSGLNLSINASQVGLNLNKTLTNFNLNSVVSFVGISIPYYAVVLLTIFALIMVFAIGRNEVEIIMPIVALWLIGLLFIPITLVAVIITLIYIGFKAKVL